MSQYPRVETIGGGTAERKSHGARGVVQLQ